MKKKTFLIFAALVGLMVILSACVPGPRVTGSPGLALADEYVVVAYRNFVYRLDLNNGSVEWQYPEKANSQVVFYAPPLVTEDYVYVGDLANSFHKLDIETGREEWTFSEAKGYFIGAPAEADGVVYAPCNDGNLYAIDENGALLWSFKTDRYIWSQPQLSDDTIFTGSMDHVLYALTKDGDEIWSFEMAGAITGTPILSEDGETIYVGSIGNDLVALDTSTGEQRWSFETEDSIWGGPALTDGLLFAADASGNLYGLDPKTGSADFQTEFEGSAVGDVVALADGIVVATEEGVVKAFNMDGSSKWEATLAGEIFQAPVVNDEYLLTGTINGENLLYAFNLSGVQLWSTTPEN